MNDSDDKIYWRILDSKSQTHVFVNKHIVPKRQFVPLNDNDLISVGGNNTSTQARGNKKIFLYRIKAPLKWDPENAPVDENDRTSSNEGILKIFFLNFGHVMAFTKVELISKSASTHIFKLFPANI